jgi:glycosyltransferase involved in cell wall biosynthesis
MSGPPRVLFVGAFPPPGNPIIGGMVTSCRALLASTLPERVRLDLLDSTQFSNPPPSMPVRVLLAAVRLLRFVARFEANRPDVVLLFVAVGASIVEKGAMARYARLRGVPAIMFPRGGSIVDDARASAFTRMWARYFFRGARKLICQADSWRQFAIDTLGFEPSDVSVLRNWTATSGLLDIGAQRPARRQGPVRLLFIGWLERSKGVFELLSACRELAASHCFTLEFVGDGHAAAEARARVSEYGLSEIVRFTGWLQGDALQRALRDADVFVLPSWAEGLPNSMIEAMAARLAVVVTSVGAIPELIADRISGLLVAPKDVSGLRQALATAIEDEGQRLRLADEAYRIAKRDFGVEAAVDAIVAQIDGAIAPARAGREPADGQPKGRRSNRDVS